MMMRIGLRERRMGAYDIIYPTLETLREHHGGALSDDGDDADLRPREKTGLQAGTEKTGGGGVGGSSRPISAPRGGKRKRQTSGGDRSGQNSSSPSSLGPGGDPQPKWAAKKHEYKFKRTAAEGAPKGQRWKTLKQIVNMEKYNLLPAAVPTYANISVPPSMLPAKKYSDISGYLAKYTDPRTGLRFASSDEYATIRLLDEQVVEDYLGARRANQKLK